MSGIPTLGIGAGLNLESLLDSLKSSEQKRLLPIAEQINTNKTQISAFGQITSALEKFQGAAQKLSNGDDGVFNTFNAKVTGSAVTAETTETASAGRFDVTVSQLARAQSQVTNNGYARDATFSGGTLTFSGGSEVTIEEGSSLSKVRDAINASGAGVTASLVNDGGAASGDTATPWRLVLTSNETGTQAASTLSAASGGMADLFGANGGNLDTSVQAQNAQLNVNGIAITSQSNTVENAIQGVTLTLNETTQADSPNRVEVGRDDESLKTAIKDFVTAWNAMDKSIDKTTKSTGEGEDFKGGVLTGNSTVRNLQSSLRDELNSRIGGEGMNYLFEAGISFSSSFSADKRGQLEIDEDKLDEAIANDPDGLRALFSGTEEAPGIATQLDSRIEQMLSDDGAISRATSGLESAQDRLEARGQRMKESIEATIERYRTQFQQLDSIMSRMNSTQSYLTQQLGMLNNPSSGNS
ncbi:flagellar filament capping protein FliD [Kushneria aurantia]|uniref:Flagellar hook-associated protein 2 n=1 Tax=Kushneria aurantia TaxID=504092 RepID=A0ABV6G127_9GAMM|nr:flagellar filament capping protein FliD [Kushneria aurantia]